MQLSEASVLRITENKTLLLEYVLLQRCDYHAYNAFMGNVFAAICKHEANLICFLQISLFVSVYPVMFSQMFPWGRMSISARQLCRLARPLSLMVLQHMMLSGNWQYTAVQMYELTEQSWNLFNLQYHKYSICHLYDCPIWIISLLFVCKFILPVTPQTGDACQFQWAVLTVSSIVINLFFNVLFITRKYSCILSFPNTQAIEIFRGGRQGFVPCIHHSML